MASKRGKYHYKIDELRGLLSPQDLIEFNDLCQWNPTYASIRGWFALRGHKISINAIHHWWKANYLDREEIKFVNALVDHLDIKDGHRLHASALKLAVMATSILDAHFKGKLASADPKFLVERQREIFTRVVEVARS
jgi:hypothetical protein